MRVGGGGAEQGWIRTSFYLCSLGKRCDRTLKFGPRVNFSPVSHVVTWNVLSFEFQDPSAMCDVRGGGEGDVFHLLPTMQLAPQQHTAVTR